MNLNNQALQVLPRGKDLEWAFNALQWLLKK